MGDPAPGDIEMQTAIAIQAHTAAIAAWRLVEMCPEGTMAEVEAAWVAAARAMSEIAVYVDANDAEAADIEAACIDAEADAAICAHARAIQA